MTFLTCFTYLKDFLTTKHEKFMMQSAMAATVMGSQQDGTVLLSLYLKIMF